MAINIHVRPHDRSRHRPHAANPNPIAHVSPMTINRLASVLKFERAHQIVTLKDAENLKDIPGRE